MLEKSRQSLDKEGEHGTLLTDLSEALDCLSHDLLIAKLQAYGLDIPALRLLHNYLSNKKRGVEIDRTFSSWEEILFDVFLFISDIDIASQFDNNSPYTVDKNPEK